MRALRRKLKAWPRSVRKQHKGDCGSALGATHGAGRLGVGWMTSQPADGVVEWTQTFETGQPVVWQEAWFSEDGLRQANGTAQRAVIEGYDPTRPIRFRARSRAISSFKPYKVIFDEPVRSQERFLPAMARPNGAVSFIVFNDIHNRTALYQPLLNRAGAPIDFAILNGDVLQGPAERGGDRPTSFATDGLVHGARDSLFSCAATTETRGLRHAC